MLPILLLAALPLGAGPDLFQRDIQPLLKTYCVQCHSGEQAMAGVNFLRFNDQDSLARDRRLWTRALHVLREQEMPPVRPLPSVEERERLILAIDESLRKVDWSRHRNPGNVPIGRLTRAEYNHTIRDLTGLDLRPADAFPADSAGESGFTNDRQGLFLSPLLIEKYLAAANLVVDEILASRRARQPFRRKLEVEDMRITETGTPKKPYGYDVVVVQNTVFDYVRFPRTATYSFEVRAWGQSGKTGWLPGLSVAVDGSLIGQTPVTASEAQPTLHRFQALVRRGSRRVSLHFYPARTDAANTASAMIAGHSEDGLRPVLSLDSLEVSGESSPSESGARIFIAEPGPSLTPEQAARKVLSRFATRAYRRPVTEIELTELLSMLDKSKPFDEAVSRALKAVLVSPNFLLRVEGSSRPGVDYRLNDYELASRLSYFLWLSMPDDELLEAARLGRLRPTLPQQVDRMLGDPRSRAFIDSFFPEWLGYSELGRTAGPDPKTFPEFTPPLRGAMLGEASEFFASLFADQTSLVALLNAGYTFLNEDLARHYGIANVVGREFRKVRLTDPTRGGITGMGAILTATSLPVRTSPVTRGKWILETLLGDKLPPPPANAGDLPEPDQQTGRLTIRQRFELHRKAPQCASCHNRIDPLGYGLENFDAIGRWRTTDNGQPVDSAGVLRTGERFTGPAGLKQVMIWRQDVFVRNLSERMLRFALGRELRYYDEPEVDRIAKAVIVSGYRPSALIHSIVSSYPFQFKRSE